MAVIDHHEPGTFCWAELATTEPSAARDFYGALLGWSSRDTPMTDERVYTMLTLGDSPVAALHGMRRDRRRAGVPSHWLSYVAVNDVDETARRAAELGGVVVLEPADVDHIGRMAVILDPTGATLALWQAHAHIGAHRLDEDGASCWNELATHDPEEAARFYCALFDWRAETVEIDGTRYTTFHRGALATAGMVAMDPSWGDVPPHWMVYFQVAKAGDVVERARELGGDVRTPATDIPPVGRFAVIGDPQGAEFSILQPAPS
ncbi:MAG: VOC family protein [Myxococcales bacterium]|nr:VOC family protein [Myxococcales bacterium]MCB9748835.1 VOC family protein [Myxococcales bacterium]